jgi:transcriptional regulator with XRE-family HTH domain
MPEKFSDRLKTERAKRGWSQAELAEKAGLTAAHISHFETDERTPSFSNLSKLANALNVSIDYLLGRTAEQATGAIADKLFRDFRNLTQADQETIAQMAELLAKKNEERNKSLPGG